MAMMSLIDIGCHVPWVAGTSINGFAMGENDVTDGP